MSKKYGYLKDKSANICYPYSYLPIGYIYLSATEIDLNSIYGGTWECVKTFCGGELIAYGFANNSSSGSTEVDSNSNIVFSDSAIPSKTYNIENYVDSIVVFDSGTFRVYPKGIAGMVKATMSISGLGGSGLQGFWWKGNNNELPTGVNLLNPSFGPILTGPIGANYGGNSNTYYYEITDETSSDTSFYVNPTATPYNGSFTPTSGGVRCQLAIEVYAKKGVTYMYQKTAD